MPTRKSTDAAIASLQNADKLATDAKAELLATIPLPVIREDIPFVKVVRDRTLNVRDDASYNPNDNKALYESLKTLGLQKRNPFMSFSKKLDGTYTTISGNLRGTMMEIIRSEEAKRRESEGIATDANNPLPFEYICGAVWEGLSADQERALVCDQVISKGLNEFELARAIGEFQEVNPKMSVEKIGIYFGLEKNKAQRLRMRYCMPTVFYHYRLEKSKDPTELYIKVGQEQLTQLYAAYKSDRDAGCRHREEGPAFKRAWNVILSDPNAFKKSAEKSSDESKKASILVKQSEECLASYGDTPEIKAISLALLWAAGKPDDEGNPLNLYKIQQDVKEYCDDLRAGASSPILHSPPGETVDLTEPETKARKKA